MKKSGIIFFVEGDTDEKFYKKLVNFLHPENGKFTQNKIIYKNIKGISNYKNRVKRIYENDIVPKCPDVEFEVFLCYDTDVFEFSQHPKINWKEIENYLLSRGVKKVYHIKAEKSIEDWFLKDENGIKNFLKLSSTIRAKGSNGQEKIKYLFRRANKTYIKGQEDKGFIDSLNMAVILKSIPEELEPIYKLLNIKI